jgi:hypothetical protein
MADGGGHEDGLMHRFTRWLHEPAEAPAGDIVELTRLPTEFEAEALAARLRDEGLNVAVFGSDAGGMAPHYAVAQGSRVMVLAEDLPRAIALLDDER